jgi:hypothetical protein
MYKTKLPLFASKEKHVGKKHYLFLHKDFDRSKKLSQFTFNGQNYFSGYTLKVLIMMKLTFTRNVRILFGPYPGGTAIVYSLLV